MPAHLEGFVKEVLQDLINEGLVVFYGKTKHGDAYQLNIKKLREIENLIFEDDVDENANIEKNDLKTN